MVVNAFERCNDCLNSRLIISENGWHAVCTLSGRAAIQCITGQVDKFIAIRRLDDATD